VKDIVLIGGGGHCRSAIDVIEQEGKFKISGIVDRAELVGSDVLGYSVFGVDSDLPDLAKKYKYALVTVGHIKSPLLRVKLFELAKNAGFILPNIVSPRAYIAKYVVFGQGSIIMHDTLINVNTKIGDNCIINSKVLIEHDCRIFDHCHISTGAIINGGVTVKSRCFIGSGAITKESILIDENNFFKAGSLII
jgi:sugar O-acyltransferase (sialic acid O-acetyltransferase NeuD family)